MKWERKLQPNEKKQMLSRWWCWSVKFFFFCFCLLECLCEHEIIFSSVFVVFYFTSFLFFVLHQKIFICSRQEGHYIWPIDDPLPSLNFGDIDDAGFDESECREFDIGNDGGGDIDVVVVVVEWLSIGTRPSFCLFFCFIRRFWNQICFCKKKKQKKHWKKTEIKKLHKKDRKKRTKQSKNWCGLKLIKWKWKMLSFISFLKQRQQQLAINTINFFFFLSFRRKAASTREWISQTHLRHTHIKNHHHHHHQDGKIQDSNKKSSPNKKFISFGFHSFHTHTQTNKDTHKFQINEQNERIMNNRKKFVRSK